MISTSDLFFLQKAVQLSAQGMETGLGGPFGCVIVKDGNIIAEGCNKVTSSLDPTAHAEIVAIRQACIALQTYQLADCIIYTSCEPCPMCMGAIYWARPQKVIFANTKKDAAAIEFDDDFIYKEMEIALPLRAIPFIHYPLDEALQVFKNWQSSIDKLKY